jgi:hypothetical protein
VLSSDDDRVALWFFCDFKDNLAQKIMYAVALICSLGYTVRFLNPILKYQLVGSGVGTSLWRCGAFD